MIDGETVTPVEAVASDPGQPLAMFGTVARDYDH